MGGGLPPARAGRAPVRLPPGRRHGGRPRHPRPRPSPSALPLRHLLPRALVRRLQGVHPGAGHRESAGHAVHLQRRSRGGSADRVRAAVPHRRRRQPVLPPLLSLARHQRLLLRPRGGPRAVGGGGTALRGVVLARAALGGLGAGHDPGGLLRPPRLRHRARGRARAARPQRSGAAQRRAHRHAHAPPGRAAGAVGGRAHGHGGTPVPQGGPRGAQPHRRHRPQCRVAGRHRGGPGRGGDGGGEGAGGRHPRPGGSARRDHRGVPGLRALPAGLNSKRIP